MKYNNIPNGYKWSYKKITPRENTYVDSIAKRFTIDDYRSLQATFCISLSSSCNLNCSYCFCKDKKNNHLSLESIETYLDKCFKLYPNKNKYHIDLSGEGEPLLFLDTILKIKDYCDQKSNELKREVDVRFVSNGTLLTKEVASILEAHDIWLIGVSIDGCKEIHDQHRKTRDNKPTFDTIINNVKDIEHHELMGAAVTLTKDTFSLVDSLKNLSTIFKTISYKPVRTCADSFTEESAKNWCAEYDKLTVFLLDECIADNLSYIKVLLNGDDYLGKFIKRRISGLYQLFRCDAGVARVSLSPDGKVYACPAATNIEELCLGSIENLKNAKQKEIQMLFYEQLDKEDPCKTCDMRYKCGGECLLEKRLYNGVNPAMCMYKKHLIYLADWFVDTLQEHNKESYNHIVDFCKACSKRNDLDQNLFKFLEDHPEYSFVEGKLEYDKLNNLDIEPY